MTLRAALALLACAACHHAREQPPLVIEVRAQIPGMGPEELAAAVTTPLERALANVPHVAALTSETTDGTTRIRIAFDSDDPMTAAQDVQAAINRAMPMLPDTLPSPPVYSVATTLAGRFLVPREAAGSAAERVAQQPGVGLVETCGELRHEKAIDVDRPRLAALGLTIAEIVKAVRAGSSQQDLGQIEIAAVNNVPVHLRDIATVEDRVVPPTCQIDTASVEPAELVIASQHAVDADSVRATVSKLIAGATLVPRQRELHLELAPELDRDRASLAIHEALRRVGHYVVEVRPGSARILDGGEPVLAALRQAPLVLSGGEPTTVVHVTGADPSAVASAARAIADRLRRAGTLVATHGLSTTKTQHVDIDRGRAAALGVSASDIGTTLAASTGIVATTSYTATEAEPVVVRMTTPDTEDSGSLYDELYVRGAGDALVPLASLITGRVTMRPVEILHRGQFPDVDLEVHGTPEIGAVPPGVRVEVDQYQR